MISTVVCPGAFYRNHVLCFFNYTQQTGVAVLVVANGTTTVLGYVEDILAQPNFGCAVGDRLVECGHSGFGRFQDMKGAALGRFWVDTREPARLINKTLDCTVVHVGAFLS